jgi:hypothetical protein
LPSPGAPGRRCRCGCIVPLDQRAGVSDGRRLAPATSALEDAVPDRIARPRRGGASAATWPAAGACCLALALLAWSGRVEAWLCALMGAFVVALARSAEPWREDVPK